MFHLTLICKFALFNLKWTMLYSNNQSYKLLLVVIGVNIWEELKRYRYILSIKSNAENCVLQH